MTEDQLLKLLRQYDAPVQCNDLATRAGMSIVETQRLLNRLVQRGVARRVSGTFNEYIAERSASTTPPPYRGDFRVGDYKPDARSHWNLTESARKLGIR